MIAVKSVKPQRPARPPSNGAWSLRRVLVRWEGGSVQIAALLLERDARHPNKTNTHAQ